MNRPASELPLAMPLSLALHGRCSVRSFKPHAVNRAQILGLLSAAVRAPTARHQEPWAFVVVQDRTVLKRISERAKPLFAAELKGLHVERSGRGLSGFADPNFSIFHNAGTLVVVCGPADAPFVAADCWLAAENLLLAAYAMGLGACVIGSAVGALNLEDVKHELEIPASYAAVAPIIVGVPLVDEVPTARKDPRVLHWK
jgi:nitroreductase